MELEQDINWDFLNSSFAKDISNFPFPFDQGFSLETSEWKEKNPIEVNVPEEIISTSISDIEVDCGLLRPTLTRLSCPECTGRVKAFQFNQEMAVFMCENTQVTLFI